MANSTSTQDSKTSQKTSTIGGSTSNTSSHSEGGSTSVTQGYSDTTSSSQGGSHTLSGGKSYASGQIAENTQANFDRYNQEYVQSGNVQNAYSNLQAALSGKPVFQSTYEDQLANMYQQLMNRDPFSYNFNQDNMYQLYKDQYQTAGKQAMQDTMGQLSAMNSGYGSSYSQTAGQQTYQQYLQQLNNIIPELRQQAYQEYQAEGQELLNKYNVTADAYNREYGQYRDATSDWQSDRAFNQSAYQDERNFDYSQYTDNRNYWQNQYWQEKNAEQTNVQEADSTNWEQAQSHTDSYSQTNTSYWENSNSTTNSTNWSNTNTDTVSNNINTTSKGSGSGTSTSSAVQFGNSNSHNGVYTANQRSQVVNTISDLASKAFDSGSKTDENAIFKQLQDYVDKGFTGTNGEHVQFSVEDATNVYNRAITMNAIVNGKRQEGNNNSKNLGQTLSVEEMARKIGIRP